MTVADVLDLVSALAWLAEGDRAVAPTRLLDLVLDGLDAPEVTTVRFR